MFEIRRANKEELQGKIDLKDINLPNTLFIIENENILGWATYDLINNYGILKKLYINPMYTILKDALIRSVLNMMDYLNVDYFLLENDDETLYRKIGFKNLKTNNIFHVNSNKYLYISIEEFFNSSCQCKCSCDKIN